MKVLVTGGAGYIGSITAKALEEAGHTPVILDSLLNGPRAFVRDRIFYEGDIADRALLRRIVEEHPDLVRAFVDAHLEALELIASNPAGTQAATAAQIKKITEQQEIDPEVLEAAWGNLEFTPDPLPDTLKASADHADAVGLLPAKPSDGFADLWDLTALNEALAARGDPEVAA